MHPSREALQLREPLPGPCPLHRLTGCPLEEGSWVLTTRQQGACLALPQTKDTRPRV